MMLASLAPRKADIPYHTCDAATGYQGPEALSPDLI
jgi:hypothetical protein